MPPLGAPGRTGQRQTPQGATGGITAKDPNRPPKGAPYSRSMTLPDVLQWAVLPRLHYGWNAGRIGGGPPHVGLGRIVESTGCPPWGAFHCPRFEYPTSQRRGHRGRTGIPAPRDVNRGLATAQTTAPQGQPRVQPQDPNRRQTQDPKRNTTPPHYTCTAGLRGVGYPRPSTAPRGGQAHRSHEHAVQAGYACTGQETPPRGVDTVRGRANPLLHPAVQGRGIYGAELPPR